MGILGLEGGGFGVLVWENLTPVCPFYLIFHLCYFYLCYYYLCHFYLCYIYLYYIYLNSQMSYTTHRMVHEQYTVCPSSIFTSLLFIISVEKNSLLLFSLGLIFLVLCFSVLIVNVRDLLKFNEISWNYSPGISTPLLK